MMPQQDQPGPAIGGHEIIDVLAPDRTYLAQAPGGRLVVLKMLDEECLLRGKLHPSIRERLARVRELAEKGVANLHGVERDGQHTYMVWDYVSGGTLADESLVAGMSQRQFLEVARELVLTLDSLHGSGIVHGAIKPGNVVIRDGQGVRLTHVSPLLFSDPRQDADAVMEMLIGLVSRRRESELPLGRALADARSQSLSLRQLSGRLSGQEGPREAPVARRAGKAGEAKVRRRSLWSAAVVALMALAAGAAVWWLAGGRELVPWSGGDLPAVEIPAASPQGGAK
jgi:serine/threonine protein kinase